MFCVGDGIGLEGVDKGGKQHGVAEEENRGVVSHQVPIALFGVEFNCEASQVTRSVRSAPLSA